LRKIKVRGALAGFQRWSPIGRDQNAEFGAQIPQKLSGSAAAPASCDQNVTYKLISHAILSTIVRYIALSSMHRANKRLLLDQAVKQHLIA
jgi:hypothetical protein